MKNFNQIILFVISAILSVSVLWYLKENWTIVFFIIAPALVGIAIARVFKTEHKYWGIYLGTLVSSVGMLIWLLFPES